MVNIGEWNELKILRKVDFGVYLDGWDDGEILLPKRDTPEPGEIGSKIKVFVCYDSEDRLVATTQTPLAQVGEFAILKVVSVSRVGAFLDWGLPKDLFLPHAEQTKPLRVGQNVVVYLYLDKSDRISSTLRIDKFADKENINYQENEKVDLIVFDKTDLGYKALINKRHIGVLYSNEVFQPLQYAEELQGYIKQVREDGKIDLILQKMGHEARDDIAPKILKLLEDNKGFLEINDKTDAETIYDLLGVSKKKYKIALGGLYKSRLITIHEDGIRLVRKDK